MQTEVSSVRVAKISLDDFFKSILGINLILNISQLEYSFIVDFLIF